MSISTKADITASAAPANAAPTLNDLIQELPHELATAPVLRLLIQARHIGEQIGYQRCMAEGLGRIRLSSSRPS